MFYLSCCYYDIILSVNFSVTPKVTPRLCLMPHFSGRCFPLNPFFVQHRFVQPLSNFCVFPFLNFKCRLWGSPPMSVSLVSRFCSMYQNFTLRLPLARPKSQAPHLLNPSKRARKPIFSEGRMGRAWGHPGGVVYPYTNMILKVSRKSVNGFALLMRKQAQGNP